MASTGTTAPFRCSVNRRPSLTRCSARRGSAPSKTSIRFSTALRVADNTWGGATLTFGTDHTDLSRERLGHEREWVAATANDCRRCTTTTSNLGVFCQVKVDVSQCST